MVRTARRPLPSGSITTSHAWMLAGATYIASNAIFLACFPPATLAVANAIFFGYIGIYTPMKRTSTFNTAVGAVVGALTPYIGYTAAGGSLTDPYPLYYAAYMMFWQFQHFYGIAWTYQNDYKAAGYKMCDNKHEALFYMLSSFGLAAATNYALFFTSPIDPVLGGHYCLIMSAVYAATFIYPVAKFYMNPSVINATSMKNFSYIHLSAFFLILLADFGYRYCYNKYRAHKQRKQVSKTSDNIPKV